MGGEASRKGNFLGLVVAGRCKAPRGGTRPTGIGRVLESLWVAGSAMLREGMGSAAACFHFLQAACPHAALGGRSPGGWEKHLRARPDCLRPQGPLLSAAEFL